MNVSVPTRPNRQIFRFGPYQLDTALRRLVRAGTDVPLPPKPASFVILLLQHAETSVPKQDFRRGIWGGDVVRDGSVFQAARLVRTALGTRDHAGENDWRLRLVRSLVSWREGRLDAARQVLAVSTCLAFI